MNDCNPIYLALFTTNRTPETQEAVATCRVVVTPSKINLPPGHAKSTVSPAAKVIVRRPADDGYTKLVERINNGAGVAPSNGLISHATAGSSKIQQILDNIVL